MKKLSRVGLVLVAGVSAVALVASAAGAPALGTKTIDPHGLVGALALDGSRVAYAPGAVFVWNLKTGKTVKVSGRQTLADGGGGVEVAIAASQVAWYENSFGNLESDDYLFSSSLVKPKERLVATERRMGETCGAAAGGGLWPPSCAGKGLGGVVASGKRILVNRWTADATGSVTKAGLYALSGTKFKPVALGTLTAKAVAADSKRVAVLRTDGSLGLYSSTGKPLVSVRPSAQVEKVALSGHNLVVLEAKGKLALYDAGTGALRKTFTLHGNPDRLLQQALSVQGKIAVYAVPARYNTSGGFVSESAIRVLNLSTGKDRSLARVPGQSSLTRINSFGLVYSYSSNGFVHNRLVFIPFKQVAALSK